MNKYYIFIVSIIILFLVGCDGQDLKHQSAVEVLKKHKLLDSFSEQIQFTPKNYTEIQRDTILKSGYSVKIKYYSNMELSTSILKNYTLDSLKVKHYYRRFNAEVKIIKREETVFYEVINATFIEEQGNVKIKDYILTNIEVNQFPENENYSTQLDLEFCQPENKSCKYYILILQEDNTYITKETDNNYVRT